MSKPRCKYWDKCYRVNPQHLRDYQHPPDHINAVRSNVVKDMSKVNTSINGTPGTANQTKRKQKTSSGISPDIVVVSPGSPSQSSSRNQSSFSPSSPIIIQPDSPIRLEISPNSPQRKPIGHKAVQPKSVPKASSNTPLSKPRSSLTTTPVNSSKKAAIAPARQTPITNKNTVNRNGKTPSSSSTPGVEKKSLSSLIGDPSPVPKGNSPSVLANIKATLEQTNTHNGPKRLFTDGDSSPSSSRKRPCNRETKFDRAGWQGNIDSSRYYLTRVMNHPDHFTNNIALSMRDVLSLDKVIQSWHFSYVADVDWLLEEYPSESSGSPVTIVLGPNEARSLKEQVESVTKGTKQTNKYSYVTIVEAKLPIPYGTHHTKMMVLRSDAGIRVVVHTANLMAQDWLVKTQGMWISPLCPLGPGDSNFKKSLLEYLGAYRLPALNALSALLAKYDMSSITVELVASVPGRHTNTAQYGHTRLRALLAQHIPAEIVRPGWRVVSQCSSIGSLGKSPDVWLTGEFAESLGTVKGGVQKPILQLVFPTVECIRNSLEGYCGGSSVPYSIKTHQKQPWLSQHMCQWESSMWGRSRIVPHIKTYCRVAPNKDSNLSKAAWGQFEKNRSQLMIRSYELGVLFVGGTPLDVWDRVKEPKGTGIIIPYDVPPKPYTKTDKPWLWDVTYSNVDRVGNKWPLTNY